MTKFWWVGLVDLHKGGDGKAAGRACPTPTKAVLKPTLPKFLSKFRQKVQKCDFRLTFLRFYGMLKTKSLSTSVRCKETTGFRKGYPFLVLRSWGA